MTLTPSINFTSASWLSNVERERHEPYMTKAIDLAETSPTPFGAVIVNSESGEVVCEGINQHEENPTFHAEMVAINNCAQLNPQTDWRHLSIYTSAEPCPMCQSAIVWAGITQVIYATSIDDLIQLGIRQIHLDSPTVAAATPFYNGSIIGGILKSRADEMYRRWTQSRAQ